MRNLIIILFLGVFYLESMAQVKLTNETHGFIPNEKNPMILTKYVEPGSPGKSVVWNFSDLETTTNFVGLIQDNYVSKCCALFPQGNIVLEEFGNFFVFEASQNKLEQFGYLSSTGSTQIVYSKPFVKMQYPFTYGSVFSGNFEGDYILNGNKIGKIYGSYKVEGDALGVLKLPNGKELDNTLRVKEVKTTKQVVNNTATSIEDVTYRWYVSNHRFPVLVLIKSTYTFTDGNTSSHTKAAFNSNVININTGITQIENGFKLDIYPNPYQGRVNIEYNLSKNSMVNISVFDLTGKLVQVVVNETENAGTKRHFFSASELGMPAGAYIVKLRVDKNEISRKILEIK